MKKQFPETTFIRKSFSNPQLKVVKLAGADVISTSGDNAPIMLKDDQGYEEEDW